MTGLLRAIALILALAAGSIIGQAAPSYAQATGSEINYSAWESAASRAEDAIEEDTLDDPGFETLRAEIADWRERLLSAQTTNEGRLELLREQIAALGPVPAEGQSEPEEIEARRTELEQRLAQLEAPQRAADEAYTRADGLISEIDRLLRERQADKLLQLGPSPLNPAVWPPALFAMVQTASAMMAEFEDNWAMASRRAEMRANLPATIVLFLIALGLVTRGRRWMERLTNRAARRQREEGRQLLIFVVSLGQVVLPVLGLFALLAALSATAMLGPRGEAIQVAIFGLGLSVFASRWLGARVFPRGEGMDAPILLTAEQRTEGRWYTTTLGVLMGLGHVLASFGIFEEHSIDTLSIVGFPIVVVGGLVLFRLGQFLTRAGTAEATEDEAGTFRSAILRLGGRAVMLVGIGGPVLAGIGYFRAAEALLYPTVFSLALVALIALLNVPIRDLYALISGKDRETAGESLVPTLFTLLLALLSTPLFAIIWGARPTDLLEIWARIREGVSFGDTRIAPGDFMTFAVVFAIGYALTRLVQGTLRSTVLPKTRMDAGGRNAITSGVGYLGIFLAALIAITSAGINLSSLAVVAGALSVGIGFGLQNIVSNFVSGIILLIERPISEGDWIEVNGQMGIVKDISVRSTRIETFDRTDVIVPNADFVSGAVTNWTRGNLIGRVTVSVGVAYDSDSRKVERILREVCEAHPLVSMNPEPKVFFRRFGADALEFDCFCVLRDVNFKLAVHSELNHEIHARFREEGIEIPFAQRDVWLRNPEALTGRPVAPGKPEAEPREPPPDRVLQQDPHVPDDPSAPPDQGDD